MIPWQLLDSTQVPGEYDELRLYKRGGEFSIRVNSSELMNSRVHGSEDAMAELAGARIASHTCPQVLIGGLGMGPKGCGGWDLRLTRNVSGRWVTGGDTTRFGSPWGAPDPWTKERLRRLRLSFVATKTMFDYGETCL